VHKLHQFNFYYVTAFTRYRFRRDVVYKVCQAYAHIIDRVYF